MNSLHAAEALSMLSDESSTSPQRMRSCQAFLPGVGGSITKGGLLSMQKNIRQPSAQISTFSDTSSTELKKNRLPCTIFQASLRSFNIVVQSSGAMKVWVPRIALQVLETSGLPSGL